MGEMFARVTWIDALDIVIVACAIYQVLVALRGTPALQMVLGLLAVYAGSWAAREAGLLTLQWILHYLLAAGFILILIVFQPEVRRALALIGRRGLLFRPLARSQDIHLIDEVVRAAGSLAAQRMGAIVVLERNTRLSDFIEGGVTVDGLVSRRLLESLFHPRTPLHDGAAIVSDGRLAAASCLLPLSVNPALPHELGTRHRAAVGLTEETDAVAVVVSEETGAISLAAGGELEQVPEPEALRRRLVQLMGAPARGAAPRPAPPHAADTEAPVPAAVREGK